MSEKAETMGFEHGESVVYTGPCQFGLETGQECVVFGSYPQPPQRYDPTQNDYLAIRVPDPTDRFGGVVSMPVGMFKKLETQP